ncbi:MAG: prevent-host-death family protein [Rhizobacter sp.]|nr:prevent-host-death family protein [Rhizobacter sp.]
MDRLDKAVGAFEAKTHLSSLLERVAQGEAFVITRHGRPIARLSPADHSLRSTPDVLSTIVELRAGHRLGRAGLQLRLQARSTP